MACFLPIETMYLLSRLKIGLHHEKTNDLHMRKQRCRSEAVQRLCFCYTSSTILLFFKSEISSLAIFCACTARLVQLVTLQNPHRWFSHEAAELEVLWSLSPFLQLALIGYCYNNWAVTRENRSSGFPTRSDTNRPVQSQKQARSLKFRIKKKREIVLSV